MTALGAEHRHTQLALRARTILQLRQVWPALDLTAFGTTYPGWARAVGMVVQAGRDESADIAAAYLLDAWDAAGIPQGQVVRPGLIVPQRLATSLLVTSIVAYRTSLAAGNDPPLAEESAFVANAGSMTRLVLEAGRETITGTVTADGRGKWERLTAGNACDFCLMLAERGAAYLAEETASFEAHDHCGCNADFVPAKEPSTA